MDKQCTGCKQVKPLIAYPKNNRVADGRAACCKTCLSEYSKEHYNANKQSYKKKCKSYKLANKEKIKQYHQLDYLKNKDKYAEQGKHYRQQNRGLIAESTARRRADLELRTPSWCNRQLIINMYEKAQEYRTAGLDVHVDHVIPLHGKLVSGLHVHNNLQVLSAIVNVRKGNTYNPEAT